MTGGEPLLRSDILDVLRLLSDYGMILNLYTNGMLLDKPVLDAIEPLRIRSVIVSVDGMRAATHDSFRGVPGAFDQTLRGLGLLTDRNINCRLNLTCTPQNAAELPELIDYAYNELAVESVVVAPIIRTGRGAGASAVPADVVAALQIRANRASRTLDSPRPQPDTWCGVGKDMLYVDSVGGVQACPTLTTCEDPRFGLGSIHEDGLAEIVSRLQARRDLTGCQCRDISTCPDANTCRGGCRSRALLNFGDINAPDQVMCDYFCFRKAHSV